MKINKLNGDSAEEALRMFRALKNILRDAMTASRLRTIIKKNVTMIRLNILSEEEKNPFLKRNNWRFCTPGGKGRCSKHNR